MKREEIYSHIGLAGNVVRYHTWPVIQHQTVGAHCWRVATLYCEIFGIPRGEVLYFCLHHDSGELFAGDIPFGIKRHMTGLVDLMNRAEGVGMDKLGIRLPPLDPVEFDKVKICDVLEMWEFGNIERQKGNRFADPVITGTAGIALERAMAISVTHLVQGWLMREERRYAGNHGA